MKRETKMKKCSDCNKGWRLCNCGNESMKRYAQAVSNAILGCGVPMPNPDDYKD